MGRPFWTAAAILLRRWWKSVEVDGKWMKVDLRVTNNKMSPKKVEETEFQRTARILGVLFPAPPISSATPIPGPGSYCLNKSSSSFPANQFCKCAP